MVTSKAAAWFTLPINDSNFKRDHVDAVEFFEHHCYVDDDGLFHLRGKDTFVEVDVEFSTDPIGCSAPLPLCKCQLASERLPHKGDYNYNHPASELRSLDRCNRIIYEAL